MGSAEPLLLRARVVLPVSRPPIEDGAVAVSGGQILAVGAWRQLRRDFSVPVRDLGEVVMLPGLINAHCHLDYTHMAGLFPPQRSFCDWIKLITTEKAQWIFSDYANSWIAGARMLVQSGTTTVADMEAVPELLPDVWNATPLRVFSFLEMTGVRSRREPEVILAEAVTTMDAQPPHRGDTGLSPHAPYSTSPSLLEQTAALARKRKLRLVTHVAESATEFEMFTQARGEMFEWLHRNRRDMSDCDGRSPVQQLARCRALGPHLLAVHVNYLAPGDATLLARKRKLRLVTHVAESATEFEMFTQGRGEMFEWLHRNRRDMSDCDGRSPVQHLARCQALGPHLLAVHMNYLAPGDAALLARKRVSVVHCPSSHDYFRHRDFPRRELARAGVNVCLGTDSLASVRKHPKREIKLSLFREMRMFATKHSEVSAREVLQMTTLNAAHALGLGGKAGQLRPGAFADLIALPLNEKLPDIYEAIIQYPGDIAVSMIGGEWAKTPGDN